LELRIESEEFRTRHRGRLKIKSMCPRRRVAKGKGQKYKLKGKNGGARLTNSAVCRIIGTGCFRPTVVGFVKHTRRRLAG
jgi:hypothetical protein